MVEATQFQSREELDRYLSQPRIRCLECGRRLKKLGVHLRTMHGMEPDDYRIKYGIPYGIGLACPELRELARDQVKARTDPARMKELNRLGHEKRKVVPHRSMADAPIIRKTNIRVTARMRSIMLANEREHGPSETKIVAAKKNLEKAAARLAKLGPSEKQRTHALKLGQLFGGASIDKMLASLGRHRTAHSPETVAAVRAERATGASARRTSPDL